MDVVIGIDIGGTNFRIGAVDGGGNIYSFEKKSSAEIFENDPIEILYREISGCKTACENATVRAVSIGIPSIVSKDKKTVYSTPNLKGFNNINLSDPLSERLGIPVFIDRDVNFLLENDIYTLSLEKEKIITGFYIGTGFGNAIYSDGRFFTGKNGAAGELGHIPLYSVEEKCSCGNYSCAETRCSGRRLEYLAEKYFPDTTIREIFVKHAENPIIRKYVHELAIPIATEINILDPDYIVIAGGVIIMPDFPKNILLDAIHYYARKPYPESNMEILFTSHTQQSGVIGGAKFAFEKLSQANINSNN